MLRDFIIRVQVAMQARMDTKREEGQALVEYALILALVAVVAMGTLQVLGTDVSEIFTSISTCLTDPTGGNCTP
jgi:pilus assembly protein Flp/PilA